LAAAPAFLPGQQGNGFKRPTTLEMIQKNLIGVLPLKKGMT
jgi:hypothetical protein